MPYSSPHDEPTNVFVLARSLCREGRVKVSRKDRLTFGLVELRDRIRREFLTVAKDWQVSAQELRRDYSYAYPVPVPGKPDLLCLEHACEDVMIGLRSNIQSCAEQSGVPDDLLETMVVDWLVSDQMGKERLPARFYAPETGDTGVAFGETGVMAEPKDRLPLVADLLRDRGGKVDASTQQPAREKRLGG